MKNYLIRIKRIENYLSNRGGTLSTIVGKSIILDPEEEIPYEAIMKLKGNHNKRIYVIPSFGGDKKIVVY
jgi:hypothetical protein